MHNKDIKTNLISLKHQKQNLYFEYHQYMYYENMKHYEIFNADRVL